MLVRLALVLSLALLLVGDLTADPVQQPSRSTLTSPTLSNPTISGTVRGSYTLSSPVLSGTATGTYTLGGTPTLADGAVVGLGTGTATGRIAGMFQGWDTTTATTAGVGAETLKSVTVPANTLSANGRALKVTIVYQMATNANNKRVRILLGSTEMLDTGNRTDSNVYSYLVAHITRTGAAAQNSAQTKIFGSSSNPRADWTTGTENFATNLTLAIEGTTSAQAGDLTILQWRVDYE